MTINDVIIPEYMLEPNPNKLLAAKKYYQKNGKLDRPIIVDENNILRDGYARYLVLKDAGYTGDIYDVELDCTFAYCVHGMNPKEFVWRLKPSLAKKVSIGDKILVPCKNSACIVTIVELTSEPPKTNWPIKVAKRKVG